MISVIIFATRTLQCDILGPQRFVTKELVVCKMIIGICVPTIREEQIAAFLNRWYPYWRIGSSAHDVRVFIHEDHAERQFALKVASRGNRGRLSFLTH